MKKNSQQKVRPFLIGVLLIFMFIFWLSPYLQHSKINEYIRENDIDAKALFYTESPTSRNATFEMEQKKIGKKDRQKNTRLD
jgi:hypothetical protein